MLLRGCTSTPCRGYCKGELAGAISSWSAGDRLLWRRGDKGVSRRTALSSNGVTMRSSRPGWEELDPPFPLVPCKEGLVFLLPGDRDSPQLLSVEGFSEVGRPNLSQERQAKAPSSGLTAAIVLSQEPEGRRSGFRGRVPKLPSSHTTHSAHTLSPQLCSQTRHPLNRSFAGIRRRASYWDVHVAAIQEPFWNSSLNQGSKQSPGALLPVHPPTLQWRRQN